MNLWEPFGIKSTPFFQEELRVSDTDHPVSLFVGRDAERQRLLRRIVSDSSSRTVVQGDPGVGKTSFVNRLKADAAAHGVVGYEHPIRITSETSLRTFVAEALRTVLRIRMGAGGASNRFWEKTIRVLEGEEIVGGSASMFGFGAGVTRGYIAPQAPPDSLFEHLGEALTRIAGELGAPVLLHVDNFENLSATETEAAARLILDIRDYLQLRGAHWLFVGASGIDEHVFRMYTQVSGIFPEAETLLPLTPGEIAELLALRYQHLALPDRTLVPPLEPDDGARLYRLYAGDLRNFLRLLSDAAERTLGLREARPMTSVEVLRATRSLYASSLRRQLGDNDLGHLAGIASALAGKLPEFRVTDIYRPLNLSQPGASQLVGRLVAKRAIAFARQEGKSTWYRLTGPALVGIGYDPESVPAAAG